MYSIINRLNFWVIVPMPVPKMKKIYNLKNIIQLKKKTSQIFIKIVLAINVINILEKGSQIVLLPSQQQNKSRIHCSMNACIFMNDFRI